ncbi:MAG: DNA internalization-related competence protein ComEC/Rec2 [Syntrophaceae bacterium]
MERPLLPLLFANALGIAIGNSYQLTNLPLFISLVITLIFLLIASINRLDKLIPATLLLSSVLLGILNINVYLYQKPGSNHISHYINKNKVTVEGIIIDNPQLSPDRTELTVSTSSINNNETSIPVEGLVLLSVDNNQEFHYGDYVRFKTRLKSPYSFQNPGGFDYEKYLRYKGIKVRAFIKDSSGIVTLRENQGNRINAKLQLLRRNIKKFIKENSQSPEREIIQAMILGDQKEIPKDVMENFNKTGTTHIIAISGFNIGIVAIMSFFIIRLIMKSSKFLLLQFNIIKISTIFGIMPVILYTFIAGMGISVIRASIMAIIFMIAIILGKDKDLYNSLSLAALIILVISPYSLFDISFQLSFTAVWAIIFIAPRITMMLFGDNTKETLNHKYWIKKIYKNICIFIIVSLSATLGTIPLIVFYFNRVSTVVLLSNLIVVPILGIIAIPICMAIIIVVPLSQTLALFFLNISASIVHISISLVDFFASIPGSSFFISTPTVFEIAAYYLFLVAAVKFIDVIKKKSRDISESRSFISPQWYGISLVALTIFFIVDAIYLYANDKMSDKLKVTVIDVGQGSATLVELSKGKKMLIDGGGMHDNVFDIGKYVVAPYLWHERINAIDIVVLTHPHPDHLNGLIYILSHFNVKEVWSNGEPAEIDTYKKLMEVIKEKKIVHRLVSKQSGDIEINNVIINILNPPKPITMENNVSRKFNQTNNDAVVLRFTLGNVSILLPSDVSELTETCLVSSGKNIKSQVISVPHHGGFTSSAIPFLKAVKPEIALVSCGRDNVYKDPHPDVLERYASIGTKILRTDNNGAISITTDGFRIEYDTFK